MGLPAPDRLIVNSPYEEPAHHWEYDVRSRSWSLDPGRHRAGYVVATPGVPAHLDPGIFIELPLVNRIRERVAAWRQAGYPGTTGITRRLLEHWCDPEQRPDRRLFFCQLEAIETLIWLAEAPASDRTGIDIPRDGGPFMRLCAKMATGSGKTAVMAMLIAWQVLNKVTYPQDRRFSHNVLVVTPGITVKDRLSVLVPKGEGHYYDEFNLVPSGLTDRLRQDATCHVKIVNWQHLTWETEDQLRRKKGVDKRGPKSDMAYVHDVLGDMERARNLLVVNDEAHHAWRVPPGVKVRDIGKDEVQQATQWIAALDRLNRARGILTCYDFSATPMAPFGRPGEEALFDWIVSDFGLEDAIESGLVKTPRVTVRSDAPPDAKTYRPKLFHIYADPDVRDDLNRPAPETAVLPSLVVNAYALLGHDWVKTCEEWEGQPTPPVMISVANRTETAARIKYALDHGHIAVPELCAPARTLHIDTKVLNQAEAENPADADGTDGEEAEDDENGRGDGRKRTKVERAQWLRRQVNTVGQPGQPGGLIQHVISVGMLSEGWDARTVTHILGLRAFTSQLLCEQVVGRGLRRTTYELGPYGLFAPEYVNVFGVPFRFLPHEGGEGPPPPPRPPATRIAPDPAKHEFEIRFPSVVRIERTVRSRLELDPDRVTPLELDAARAVLHAELTPTLQGNPHPVGWTEIELESYARKTRLQTLVFDAARRTYDQMRPAWRGSPADLLGQVVSLVERFMRSEALVFKPPTWGRDEMRRKVLLMIELNRVVGHVWNAIEQQNVEVLEPVFDDHRPVRSTADMRPWFTSRPTEGTERSHINCCVHDGTWETAEAYALDHSPHVEAWVKNDHLGFEVAYVFQGATRKYRPDFLVRLKTGMMLVLEVKGQDSQEARIKRDFLDEWVMAINAHGGFGRWATAVSRHPRDVGDILELPGHTAAEQVGAAALQNRVALQDSSNRVEY